LQKRDFPQIKGLIQKSMDLEECECKMVPARRGFLRAPFNMRFGMKYEISKRAWEIEEGVFRINLTQLLSLTYSNKTSFSYSLPAFPHA